MSVCKGDGKDDPDDEKKRQKRGGKGMMRAKKKEEVEKKICLSRAPRGKRKSVTVITGLSTFGKCLAYCVSSPTLPYPPARWRSGRACFAGDWLVACLAGLLHLSGIPSLVTGKLSL